MNIFRKKTREEVSTTMVKNDLKWAKKNQEFIIDCLAGNSKCVVCRYFSRLMKDEDIKKEARLKLKRNKNNIKTKERPCHIKRRMRCQ